MGTVEIRGAVSLPPHRTQAVGRSISLRNEKKSSNRILASLKGECKKDIADYLTQKLHGKLPVTCRIVKPKSRGELMVMERGTLVTSIRAPRSSGGPTSVASVRVPLRRARSICSGEIRSVLVFFSARKSVLPGRWDEEMCKGRCALKCQEWKLLPVRPAQGYV